MNRLKELTKQEYETLLKFPAYISLLAANSDGKMDEAEKKSALKFSHIKTYSCNPELMDFYRDADQVFEKNITKLDNDLPKGKDNRNAAIRDELLKLEKLLEKMGDHYSFIMHRSMKSFKDHVSKAHRNALVNFIFPMPIKGISD